ncbi:MAG: septum site-determining protein MinC [Chloroflexota bacterium]|nr:septum site-determining protein MinC [Chloroflexota bacterium]
MPTTDADDNRAKFVYSNGTRTAHVQSKLAALLDDVTVTAPQAAEPSSVTNTSVEPSSSHVMSFTVPINPVPTNPAPTNGVAAEPVVAPLMSPIVEPTPIPVPKSPLDDPAQQTVGAISIKGRTDGVAIEIGKGHWSELLANLAERLAQASDFFRGGKVALDVGARPLLEAELRQVREVLEGVGLKLGAVRTKSERTFQAALNLGLATKLEPADHADHAEAGTAGGNREGESYFVYRGNLRSGQILRRREHILVIGDINPGAEIISTGDVFVWGRLRGIVHAGADGDTRAVVVAFELDPVQLQLAGVTPIAPEEPTGFTARLIKKRPPVKRPEIAYLNGQQAVTIEPWDESKPGGIAAFRR